MHRPLLALLWLYSILHFIKASYGYDGAGDFLLILSCARRYLATAEPWQEFLANTPLHGLLVLPLAGLPDRAAILIGHAVNLGCLLGVLWLLVISTPQRLRRGFVLLGLPLLLNFRPLLSTLAMIKIEMVELLLLLLALRAYALARERLCGALLMGAALIKFIPGVLLILFAWRRRWRVLHGAALALLVLGGLTVLVYGPRFHLVYALNLIGGFTPWVENQSLHAALHRLLGPWPPTSAEPASRHPVLALLLSSAAKSLLLPIILFSGRATNEDADEDQLHRDASLWLCAVPILSGFFRDSYAVYFLIPYSHLLRILLDPRRHAPRASFLLGLCSYILIGQGFPLSLLTDAPPLLPGVRNLHLYLHLSLPLLGYLLLLASLLALGRSRNREPHV